MKTIKLVLFFLLAFLAFLLTCKKIEKEMLVTTGEVTNILTTTADVSGNILDLGEGATAFGHCYSTSPNSTVSGTKTEYNTPTIGGFTSALTGLTPGTKYYIKAYLRRGNDVVYGSEINFTTASADLPELTTTEVSGITMTEAVSGGNIASQGGTPVTARGVCWSSATITTLAANKTSNGTGTGSYTSEISGLSAGTTYYVRAYATNDGGTKLGNEISFTTTSDTPVAPSVTTAFVSSVTSNSAVCGGDVTNEGSASITAKGVCYSTSANPTILNTTTNNGTGLGSFVSNITGLDPGTKYYVRAYATSTAGTSYGTEYYFTTDAVPPTLTTLPVTSITTTSASSGGDITSTGGANITVKGVCWSLLVNPTTDNFKTTDGPASAPGTYSSNVTNLTPGLKYYIRAYATNNAGTAYGNEISFNAATPCVSFQITHYAGDLAPVTKTITYMTAETNLSGQNKCWLTMNLGADHQAVSATDDTEAAAGWYWQFNRRQGFKHDGITRTPGTTWVYPIDEASNWTSVNDPCTYLLVAGWRIPTQTEWTNVDFNGAWNTLNDAYASVLKLHGAGSLLFNNGSSYYRGSGGAYWSNTQYDNAKSWFITIDNSPMMDVSYKSSGYSVRCIRD
ncbi:MAG: hypothetical protein MUC93_02120 [Bacteroidales bacterium]|jgi:hypothetical protein|nr:hypothetical protein [Bacteroidales bacterium]